MQTVTLVQKATGQLIGRSIGYPRGSFARMRGLLGQQSLEPGCGLWLNPCSSVHTIGMQFPIDVIGLNSRMQVVKLWPGLLAWRCTWPRPNLSSIVELRSGEIARLSLRVGDEIVVCKNADA